MTVKEVAKTCGVLPVTVRRWINEGKLKAYKENTRDKKGWKINEDDLNSFIQHKRKYSKKQKKTGPKCPTVKPAMTLSQAIRIKAHVEMIINILLEEDA